MTNAAPSDALALDGIVGEGLEREPRESLASAALRMIRSGRGSTQQRVAAHCVLNESQPPWDNMRRAAFWLTVHSDDTHQTLAARRLGS